MGVMPWISLEKKAGNCICYSGANIVHNKKRIPQRTSLFHLTSVYMEPEHEELPQNQGHVISHNEVDNVVSHHTHELDVAQLDRHVRHLLCEKTNRTSSWLTEHVGRAVMVVAFAAVLIWLVVEHVYWCPAFDSSNSVGKLRTLDKHMRAVYLNMANDNNLTSGLIYLETAFQTELLETLAEIASTKETTVCYSDVPKILSSIRLMEESIEIAHNVKPLHVVTRGIGMFRDMPQYSALRHLHIKK